LAADKTIHPATRHRQGHGLSFDNTRLHVAKLMSGAAMMMLGISTIFGKRLGSHQS
jgi:hypothetical protein